VVKGEKVSWWVSEPGSAALATQRRKDAKAAMAKKKRVVFLFDERSLAKVDPADYVEVPGRDGRVLLIPKDPENFGRRQGRRQSGR
jgi:hypothetical protein